MEWIFILSPASVPLLAVVIVRHFAPHSLWLQLGAAALGGAATGAFLLSAASAMASAVSPPAAMMRGAAVGSVAGLLIGGLFQLLVAFWHWVRGRNTSYGDSSPR
ncbi:MAG: hypothetical protein ACE5IR_20410 [bacterium]